MLIPLMEHFSLFDSFVLKIQKMSKTYLHQLKIQVNWLKV